MWIVTRWATKENITGDNNTRRIHIYELNHIQNKLEEKHREDIINLFRVVHDKEMFFSDETIHRNIMNLTNFFEAELKEFNEEILFFLNSLELSV